MIIQALKLTNKLKYYQCQQKSIILTINDIDLNVFYKILIKLNIFINNIKSYTKFHFSIIFYYNINNKHKTGLK